jgi:hypothetical protein
MCVRQASRHHRCRPGHPRLCCTWGGSSLELLVGLHLCGRRRGALAHSPCRRRHTDGVPRRGAGRRRCLPLHLGVPDSSSRRLVLAALWHVRMRLIWESAISRTSARCRGRDTGRVFEEALGDLPHWHRQNSQADRRRRREGYYSANGYSLRNGMRAGLGSEG